MSRDEDVRIAELLGIPVPAKPVMVETKRYDEDGLAERSSAYEPLDIPYFTTDPAADYKVLEWMRRAVYGYKIATIYQTTLYDMWEASDEGDHREFLNYQPGDYSKALLALKDKGLL